MPYRYSSHHKVPGFIGQIINRRTIPIILLVAGIVLYNYFWDIMAGARILAFNNSISPATVWDMGAFYGRIWVSIHSETVLNFAFDVIPSPITLLMSPLSLIKDPFFFVYLQTAWISITSIPIFLISIKKLNSSILSLTLSVSFLLFFGIAGLNWYDIHFQTLFLPFFTGGVCLFYYGKYKTSALFMVLAGSVHALFMVFPVIFYLTYLIELFLKRRSFIRVRFSIIAPLVISLIFLISTVYLDYHLGGGIGLLSGVHYAQNSGGIFQRLENEYIDDKVFTFLLYLSPFMMLPLLSKRWLFPMLFYFYELLFANSGVFFFPLGLRVTESSMLIPFLFLGTIDVLEQMSGRLPNEKAKNNENVSAANEARANFNQTKADASHSKKIVVTILILTVLLTAVYQPYGALNKYSEADLGLSSVLNNNATLFDVFNAIVSLIPQNDPFVLYQNNMPEVVFRDPSTLTTELFGYSNNFTYPFGTAYTKPIWSQRVDYVIADPYHPYFLGGGSGNFSLTMYDTLQHFISQGGYGVEAEYDGLILLKRGFTGTPLIYGPEDRVFSAIEPGTPDPNDSAIISSFYSNGVVYANDATSGQTVWYGPYTFLQPGNYLLRLEVSASNISYENYFQLRFSYFNDTNGVQEVGPLDVNLFNITGNDFSASNKFINITLRITAMNFMEFVEFAGQDFHWNGNFEIKQITLVQVGPLS
jgi:uncharacterized membrane protein